MKKLVIIFLSSILALIIQLNAETQTVLKSSVIGNGGNVAQGGGITLNGTIGQPTIGVSSSTSNTLYSGFWYIVTMPIQTSPIIGLNPTILTFAVPSGGTNPASKKLQITNTGAGTMAWSVSDNADWLSMNPVSGSCTTETDEVTVEVNISGMSNGTYNGSIVVTATGASNSPQVVPVKLTIGSIAGQIYLEEGWNLISYPINQCYYEEPPIGHPACINQMNIVPGYGSLKSWFDSVISPKDAWKAVMGTEGFMDRDLPSSANSLDYMSPMYGYWVKIKKGTGGVTLSLNGPPFETSCTIPLNKGWNLIGFPINKGYYDKEPHLDLPWLTEGDWVKTNVPVVKYVFSSIFDDVIFVFSAEGVYSPDFIPSANSLHSIASGCGFWVKLKKNAILDFSKIGQGTSILAAPDKQSPGDSRSGAASFTRPLYR